MKSSEVEMLTRLSEWSNKIKHTADAEKEFTKILHILDYEKTTLLLKTLNNTVLAGVEVKEILDALNDLKTVKRYSPIELLSDHLK